MRWRINPAVESAKKTAKDKGYLIEAARLEKSIIRVQVAERAGKTILH